MMYYMYTEYNSGCGCCDDSYAFDESDDKEALMRLAASYKMRGYDITIIEGDEIPFDESFFEKLMAEKKDKEEKEKRKKVKNDKAKRKREYGKLKEEFGS